jgi:hypothetical protein
MDRRSLHGDLQVSEGRVELKTLQRTCSQAVWNGVETIGVLATLAARMRYRNASKVTLWSTPN